MFTAFGIILLVTGAIFTFALERQIDGIDLATVGWILMAGGAASLLIGMLTAAVRTAPTRMRYERHATADGHHLVEERVGEAHTS